MGCPRERLFCLSHGRPSLSPFDSSPENRITASTARATPRCVRPGEGCRLGLLPPLLPPAPVPIPRILMMRLPAKTPCFVCCAGTRCSLTAEKNGRCGGRPRPNGSGRARGLPQSTQIRNSWRIDQSTYLPAMCELVLLTQPKRRQRAGGAASEEAVTPPPWVSSLSST